MNVDILLKTRTFSKDYSWIYVADYINDSTIENIDKIIGRMYLDKDFMNTVKEYGKSIFFVLVNNENAVVSRLVFSDNLDMAGRNIYSFEGFSFKIQKIDTFFRDTFELIERLKCSNKILRDCILDENGNSLIQKNVNISEIYNAIGNHMDEPKKYSKVPYEYLNSVIESLKIEGKLEQEKVFCILDSDNIAIDTSYFFEVIYLNKEDYILPLNKKEDKINENIKSGSIGQNIDFVSKEKLKNDKKLIPVDIINFFNSSFDYKKELELKYKDDFLGLCVFYVYKAEKSYEYKIRLVNFKNRSEILFESLPYIYPLCGMSIYDIKEKINKFIGKLLKYGFIHEVGLVLKYPECNINMKFSEPIIIDIGNNKKESIKLKKGSYYSIAPITNILFEYNSLKNIINKNSFVCSSSCYKLKNIFSNVNLNSENTKKNNIFYNIFNKKTNMKNKFKTTRYRSRKWTNIVYS